VIGFIFRLSIRQLVFRRTTLALAGLCAIPLLVAFVFRLSQLEVDPERWTARVLFLGLIVTTVLPLTALLTGTSAIGDEIEDGTAIYLLTKPIERWQILAPKLAAAWLVTTVLLVPAAVVSCLIALDGTDASLLAAVALSLTVGALAYCAIFVLLSVATSRALIAGLVYVFLWEGAVTAIFAGTRYLSIRHYTLGLAGWIGGDRLGQLNAYVGGITALILIILAIAAGALEANRRLQELEVRETS
jgi:ABC-2 type transport system permease protein